ncbi:unnamed protein product [Moneuplotes crassus]|uniref:Uncharacterized protein n=1 Tax=Euplotes crassus TaxID=5936 RepID=A0AAD1UMF2_EUPCR|nr:unnamed protein product [Moneuplotes crassus]
MEVKGIDPMVLFELKDLVRSLKIDNLKLQAQVKIEHGRFATYLDEFAKGVDYLLYQKKKQEFEKANSLNDHFIILQELFEQVQENSCEKVVSLLEKAQKEIDNMKTELTLSKMNPESVDAYLFLNHEVMTNREQDMGPGRQALNNLKEAFENGEEDTKMRTLKEIEELIYNMINNPSHSKEDTINLSVEAGASYQSLSDKIREMIRHDRGFSILNSTNSNGIPSPIRESESFKKLIEYKENTENSDFNSGKVKKIEFSDTMNKDNDKKKNKKNDKIKGEANFTHSSIDRMVFEETDKYNRQVRDFGDSISETVKINNSKPEFEESKQNSQGEDAIEPSFENPKELIEEMNRYSLRSSIDEKFYNMGEDKEAYKQDLKIPSVNTSLMDYPNPRFQNPRHIIENSNIQQQDSGSHHKENSNLKMKKDIRKQMKKATKKEFDREDESNKGLNQEEIDRNSTIKKAELKDAIKNGKKENNQQETGKHSSNEFSKNEDYKMQSLEERNKNSRFNFDGKKPTEGKTFNYSVLSRSKSGDAKFESSSKNESCSLLNKESMNTNQGGNIYYDKGKEIDRSKQVLIEEIEIPLEEQNELKANEHKKTEKYSLVEKKKVIESEKRKSSKSVLQKNKYVEDKVYQKYATEHDNGRHQKSQKSDRKPTEESVYEEEVLEKKRKQSDLIIKKGKVFNIGQNGQNKSISPTKSANKQSDGNHSSSNVSFSKNKKDLFQEKSEKDYVPTKPRKGKKVSNPNMDDYSNFLKHKELNTSDHRNPNPCSVSFKKKSRNDEMREGSGKRHKTPTHIDMEKKDMRKLLGKDPKIKNQDNQNSRNDFTVYTSNTGGPSIHKEEFTNDFINQIRVKDYVQMGRGEHHVPSVSSCSNKKTLDRLSSDDVAGNIPNEMNDFNFYTPNNQQNLVNNSAGNKMYLVNKHPLSGSSGYSRAFENDSSMNFVKKSKSRIDGTTEPGYSSRLKSVGYHQKSNVNKSSSFRNLKYSHRSNSNTRKQYLNGDKSGSKRANKTKSALSTYMAYKQGMKKKKSKKKTKKVVNQNSNNFFTNKKNSVDSVATSINAPYLSPFFSSRDGRPSTIMKNQDPNNMHIDMNSAINLLQYNNMVTVDSMKSKKSKKVISLKDRVAKNKKKDSNHRNSGKNDSSSVGNRITDKYNQEMNNYNHLKGLNSNNSFGPEAYFGADLLQRNKMGGHFFTEGTPSVNESHSKDYQKSRNLKQGVHKTYNKMYSSNQARSPGKLTNRKTNSKLHPSYS